MKNILGYIFIALGLFLFIAVLYANSQFSTQTRTFSPYSLLNASWENYKTRFINNDGRVIDYSQNAVTTSEGQSYAMLRAVWIDDKTAFDKAWNWTRNDLKRPNDHLLAWHWGKKQNGSYGVLENGGDNSASDADSDVALALILAAHRWQDEKYLNDAKPLLSDLWQKETATAAGKRYLIAGNWAQDANTLVINPSYFAPYAWRIFATVDKTHDWNSLIAPAYDLLQQAGQQPLDKDHAVGLPPDWVAVDRKTGDLHAPNLPNLTTNYGFDAMRIPWRISLDYQWNHEQRAKDYLQSFQFLAQNYTNNGKLASTYSHDGQVVQDSENPVMYSTIVGAFMVTDQDLAKKVYQDKILRLYSNDSNSFNKDLPYYEQNWLWFGAALYNNHLEKL